MTTHQDGMPALVENSIAGALFDFLGFLTTSETRWKFSEYDEASPAVEALEQWAKARGLSIKGADVTGWKEALAALPPPVPDSRLDDYATEINRLRNVIQAACLGGTDLMIERWKVLFPDAPVPTVKAMPTEWDGKLHPSLQKALNDLRGEAPHVLINALEHYARESFQALWADKATIKRMYIAAQKRCDEFDAAQPDPFAALPLPVQGEAVPTGPRTEIVFNELRSALNAMMTFFGMDEDDNNKAVFDKSRQAYDYAQIVMRPLDPWERQSLNDFRACLHRWHEKAVAKGFDGVEAMCDLTHPAAQPATVERKPLTEEQIEKLREQTFSTGNPFCPVDSKSMRKAVRAAERAHGITAM